MSYTPKNNFNLKMIKTTDEVPVYTPENNSNLLLKRTGVGEVGFQKDLWKTIVGTCDDPEYYFRWIPIYDSFYRNDSQEVSVVGGVGDFSWSIEGSGFSLANATTSERTNTVSTDGTVGSNNSAVVAVVDSCGNSVSGNLKVCYNIIDYASLPVYAVYGTGYNGVDQLGLGPDAETFVTTYTASETSFKFVTIHCGNVSTFALDNFGKFYVTGGNAHGQFGDGTTINKNIFTAVGSVMWNMLGIGSNNTLALKNDGTLWGTGYNDYSILGLGNNTEVHEFTQEITEGLWNFVDCYRGMHALAIQKTTGKMFVTGFGDYGQLSYSATNIPDINTFTQIRYATTENDDSAWQFVVCGDYCSFGIKTDGTLWATGNNGNGQLGFGDTTRRRFFEQVGSSLWSSVSSANYSTVAIKEDGTLWGCGKNGYGELGLGDTTQRTSFVQIGTATWKKAIMSESGNLIAIKSDDTLWGCGRNAGYELGLGNLTEMHELTQESTTETWKDIAGGADYSMALLL